ncbi:MAG: sulfatase [Bacteroidia bacterium]|nr:sulfatase [Bacteroidia bacterium]
MKKIPFITNGLIGMSSLLSAYGQNTVDKNSSPNFIVIFTDDQSWVGTSFLSDPDDPRTKSDYYKTPNMERLAQMGMRFTDGYSAPLSNPSRRCLLTGQNPARHVMQKDPEIWPKIYRDQLDIPRMLKTANPKYKTAHFGKWDMRFDMVTPEEMGYDVSDGYTNNATGGSRTSIKWPVALDDPKLIFSVTDRAVKFMEDQVKNGNPFYLQVSHYAVHLGITYRQSTLDKYKNISPGQKHHTPEFAAMTEDLDTGIGILLDKVEELGLLKNTYIIFLADNGGTKIEPLTGPYTVPRNFPLRDGKGSCYEGGIRVPFVVAGPGVKANSVSRVPVSEMDILPTLADITGYKEVLPQVVDGGSIKNVIFNNGKGEVKRNLPYIIWHHSNGQSAIREGSFKLIISWMEKENKIELFNLSKDISESNDLSKEMPEKAKELNDKLVGFINGLNAIKYIFRPDAREQE